MSTNESWNGYVFKQFESPDLEGEIWKCVSLAFPGFQIISKSGATHSLAMSNLGRKRCVLGDKYFPENETSKKLNDNGRTHISFAGVSESVTEHYYNYRLTAMLHCTPHPDYSMEQCDVDHFNNDRTVNASNNLKWVLRGEHRAWEALKNRARRIVGGEDALKEVACVVAGYIHLADCTAAVDVAEEVQHIAVAMQPGN